MGVNGRVIFLARQHAVVVLALSFAAARMYRAAMRTRNPDRPGGPTKPGSGKPSSRGGSDRPAGGRPYAQSGPKPGAPTRAGSGFARPGGAQDTEASGSRPRDPARSRPAGRLPPADRASGPRPSRAPDAEARAAAAARTPRLGQPRPAPAARETSAAGERTEIRTSTLRAPTPAIRPAATTLPAPRASHGPAAPRGSVWLHGLHPVAAALANPGRRLKRLLLTEEAEATLQSRLPQPWPLPGERVDRAKLDHLLGRDTVHQGAGLLADLLAPPALSTVLERPGPILVLDQVTDPRNIGAVLRSAAAFGAAGVIIQDRNAPEETGALAKAASGALEQVPLLRAVNLARTLVALKAAGLWVIGLDSGGVPLRGAPLQERRVALVLGAEGDGLRRLTRETCDEIAGLAMPGSVESLNVSAAATVALYELTRAP